MTTSDSGDTGTTTGGDASSSSSGMGESSSGSGTGGWSAQCDPDACFSECSELIAQGGEYGDCYSASEEYTPWACVMGQLSEPLWADNPEDFPDAAASFFAALASGDAGLVEYRIAPDEWDNRWGTIYVIGDGTVLIDMNYGGHCGNGGGYSWRPIITRKLEVADLDTPQMTACRNSTDYQELFDCVFGAWPGSALAPDAMPWLTGSCVPDDPACP